MKRISLAFLLLLGACSFGPQVVEKPILVDRPALITPDVQPVTQYNYDWIVITKDNIQQVMKDFDDKGQVFVVFAMTPTGYQNLSLDGAEIRRYISQQQDVVMAYKKYYEKKDATPAKTEKETTWLDKIKNLF